MEMKPGGKVLVYRGTSSPFVAISLDFDVAAQGKSSRDAVSNLERAFQVRRRRAEERGDAPFQPNRKAPESYWVRFDRAVAHSTSEYLRAEVRAEAA